MFSGKKNAPKKSESQRRGTCNHDKKTRSPRRRPPTFLAGWLGHRWYTMRKLKYHEQKLLKKVDFLQWKSDQNIREIQVNGSWNEGERASKART